jgi:hypothetical protein
VKRVDGGHGGGDAVALDVHVALWRHLKQKRNFIK